MYSVYVYHVYMQKSLSSSMSCKKSSLCRGCSSLVSKQSSICVLPYGSMCLSRRTYLPHIGVPLQVL